MQEIKTLFETDCLYDILQVPNSASKNESAFRHTVVIYIYDKSSDFRCRNFVLHPCAYCLERYLHSLFTVVCFLGSLQHIGAKNYAFKCNGLRCMGLFILVQPVVLRTRSGISYQRIG
jgi:hypothetical protein